MIQSPITFQKLPKDVRNELINYLIEGNDPHDLTTLYLKAITHESMVDLIDDVKEAHQQIGDYPHTDALEIQR